MSPGLHCLRRLQESAVLWEAHPAAIMDATLLLHHATIRKILQQHRGYE